MGSVFGSTNLTPIFYPATLCPVRYRGQPWTRVAVVPGPAVDEFRTGTDWRTK